MGAKICRVLPSPALAEAEALGRPGRSAWRAAKVQRFRPGTRLRRVPRALWQSGRRAQGGRGGLVGARTDREARLASVEDGRAGASRGADRNQERAAPRFARGRASRLAGSPATATPGASQSWA